MNALVYLGRLSFSVFGLILAALLFWGLVIAEPYDSGPLDPGWANQPGTNVELLNESYSSGLVNDMNEIIAASNDIMRLRNEGLDNDIDANRYGSAKAVINTMTAFWSDGTPVPEGYEKATELWLKALDHYQRMVDVVDRDFPEAIEEYNEAGTLIDTAYASLP